MGSEKTSERFTIILVPDRTSRVHRFQVPRRLARRALWGGLIVVLIGLAGTIDYVRLRWNAIDVVRLRTETMQQREEIARFAAEMTGLQERLAQLRELERKVRIIANLPGASAEEESSEEGHPQGRGGGVDEDGSPADPGASPPLTLRVPEGTDPFSPGQVSDALPEFWPQPEVVARLRTRAGTFRERALNRLASLEELVEGLHGKSRQLASTPSIWPTRGWLTSHFGRRISPFTGRQQFHAGIDVAARFGTEVVAPGRGTVILAGRKGPLGRTVVLNHGYRIRTTYGHLASVSVRKGQKVERGEVIGTVGSSGRSTGPHLHYSVAVRGKAVDPINYIFE